VDAAWERATTDAQRSRLRRQIDQLDARLFGRGEHKVGQPLWEEVFATPRGLTLIVWACAAGHAPEFSEADAARLAAAHPTQWARAVAHVMGPFAEAVGRRLGADPERVREAVAGSLPAIRQALASLDPPPAS
jgi:hypothetical protein